MFPSNNNNGSNNDQVCFFDQSILHKPFLNDIITTNSKQDHQDPLSLFHFSSPFLSYESALEDDRYVFLQQHHDLLLNHHQQPLRVDDHNTNLPEIFVNMADSSQNDINMSTKDHSRKKNHNQQIPIRKRASKRDRHSKINTAKGLRDRRMRLSLDVARNFFGLQDMLGYDKASKTVEWLLIQAKQEIKKLEKGLPQMNYNCCVSVGAKSASSTSECTEVASGIDVEAAAIRETNISKAAKPDDEAKHNDLNQLAGSWSSFETGEESSIHSRDMNQSLQPLAPEVEEPSSHQHDHIGNQETMVDDSNLVNMGKYWSPYSSFYNCLNWNSNVLLCKCCSISSQTFNSSASHRKPLESSNDHGK